MKKAAPATVAGLILVVAVTACGGGGGGSNSSPTAPPATPGPVIASPNPLTLGASSSDANHIVSLTLSQANATAKFTSITPTGCSGYLTTTQPFDESNGVSTDGSATATLSSLVGVAPIAQGTCTIVVTPASGATFTLPVIVDP